MIAPAELEKPVPTVYEQLISRGVSRRDFLKFCAWMSAYLGLQNTGAAQIAKALETRRRIPVVWMHFQECTCCSESFLRSSHPIVADILLDKISLDYTETLQAAAGHQAEEALRDTITKYKGEYLMLVEGSVPLRRGRRLLRHRRPLRARHGARGRRGRQGHRRVGQLRLRRLRAGRQSQPDPRDADQRHHQGQADRERAGLPADRRGHGRSAGPPAHLRPHPAARRPRPPEGVLLPPGPRHLLPPRRTTTPDSSSRSFDDENARKGYCLYKVGCRGPTTYNSCGVDPLEQRDQLPHPVRASVHRLLRGQVLGQRALLPADRQLPRLRHRVDRRQDRPRRSAASPSPALAVARGA